MIHIEALHKYYRMGDEIVKALDGIDLHVNCGEFIAIVGPSGSGKSTLMNIIGCLDVADEGRYLLDDRPINKYTEKQLAKIRSEKIGFIFQGFNLLPKLSALENVELPLVYQQVNAKKRRKQAIQALEWVGLENRLHHKPTELSGGQQQRVAVARALASHPSILLADEPTGNLDSTTGREIMQLFSDLHKQGNTIVLITHDIDLARKLPRRVHIMDGHITEHYNNGDEKVIS